MKTILWFVSCFLFASVSLAEVDLISWQPRADLPVIILPKTDLETPQQAVTRYLKSVSSNSDLKTLFSESDLKDLKTDHVELLKIATPKPESKLETTRLRVAVVANLSQDMVGGSRINRFIELARSSGGEPVIIAVSADIGLSEQNADQFRNLIAHKFDVLIGIGGADVDPSLYGEERTYSTDTNLTRDRSELALIKAFKDAERGVYFGICRGHQIAAVADGHTLFQDIEKDGLDKGSDHISNGEGYSHNNLMWHHITVSDSLFLRLLKSNRTPLVTSVHHQAVRVNSQAKSVPVAYKDNVVEALEAKNKLSFTVQFHPEFGTEQTGSAEFTDLGSRFVRNLFAYSRLKRAELMNPSSPRCEAIFKLN